MLLCELLTNRSCTQFYIHIVYFRSYVNNEHKQKSLSDSISPLIPLTCLVSTFVVWGVISPNRILNAELRCFCLAFGIVSSNITVIHKQTSTQTNE